MATAQDLEHQQMSSDSPGPSAPQNSGRASQITESQGSLFRLRVEVIVLRAHNVPRIKKKRKASRLIGMDRRCTGTRRSALFPHNSLHLLYCDFMRNDVPVEISNGDGEAGTSTQPVTLYLTIAVSSDATSPIFSNTPEVLTKGDNSAEEEPTKPTPVQAEMSPVEDAMIALHRADNAKELIDRRDIWSGVVSRIKWVMDTVSPIAGVRATSILPLG
ncbi:hypothetical protein EDB83DRAFT_803148 [Lactarius deliciosus]|nr:hypothetical protein EDB83DRAFT_803148 [Lactarius deliciosus]